jgi:hypothetical protein
MEKQSDTLIVIGYANCALETHHDRTEPIFGEMNYAGGSESRNRFTDVTFLMDTLSTLIGVAGFERDGFGADAA